MPCYHPNMRLRRLGSKKYMVGGFVESIYRNPFSYGYAEATLIPCGQCSGCRLDQSRDWANRCLLELEYHDSAYFVTLTYDDEHLPITYYADQVTGEALPANTLRKRDFQLFMKRLRKAFSNDHIRFFACGEYGDDTFRPHYHAIIFGLHLNDLVFYKRDPSGKFDYFNSPSLQKVWSVVESKQGVYNTPCRQPLGFAVVAPVTWETCAYVARYCLKKRDSSISGGIRRMSEVYSAFNIEPMFTLSSTRPGIGRQYYEDHPDLWKYEYINVSTQDGGKKFRPPKYFMRLLEKEDPEKYQSMKDDRKRFAKATESIKRKQTTLSFEEALAVQERAVAEKLKKLQRRLDHGET